MYLEFHHQFGIFPHTLDLIDITWENVKLSCS